MPRVSLELLKKQVRADDFDGDDIYLEHLLQVAEAQVESMTGYSSDELSCIPDEDYPAELKQAILLRAASLYAYREDVDTASLSEVPNSTKALVKPWQHMRGGSKMDALLAKYAPEEGAVP